MNWREWVWNLFVAALVAMCFAVIAFLFREVWLLFLWIIGQVGAAWRGAR